MSTKHSSSRAAMQRAIETLATNIRFAASEQPVSTIAVTASIVGEGKTTITVELAKALAAGGKHTLLVETDLAGRPVAQVLGMQHSASGIAGLLTGHTVLKDAVVATTTNQLDFLDCETPVANATDQLSSDRFAQLMHEVHMCYDYVVFNTPALATSVDAAIVGALSDGTVLVVRRNYVKREELASAYEQLKRVDAHMLGTVVNFADDDRGESRRGKK